MPRMSLGRLLIVCVGSCIVATFAGCEASKPPATIDLSSPIKTPNAPTAEKVELKKPGK